MRSLEYLQCATALAHSGIPRWSRKLVKQARVGAAHCLYYVLPILLKRPQKWRHSHSWKFLWLLVLADRRLLRVQDLQYTALQGQRTADHGIDYHQMRASTGLQPKASKVRPVVSEHKQVVVVQGPLQFFRLSCLRLERIHNSIPKKNNRFQKNMFFIICA